MKREEKIEMIQEIIEKKDPYIGLYAELLLSMGDMKLNYRDYMITEPINCSEELKRVFNADYDLCAALLTMVLREDHFSCGSFKQRFAAGQVLLILKRISDTAGYIQRRTILGGWGNDVSFSMFLLCMAGNGETNLAESSIIDE